VADIQSQLTHIEQRIARAADRGGRDPRQVSIVAVTKTFGVEIVRDALAAGLREFGENRVQEAEPKIRAIEEWCSSSDTPMPTWHLVGHLQRNKVKASLGLFAMIQSLDSLKLARAIDERAESPKEVYLEVNVAGEQSKFGFAVAEVPAAVEAIGRMRNLRPLGLMTVAPIAEDETVRKVFRQLRELSEAVGLTELSMGMSDDYEIAVEEGATCLRLGRAIFGDRVPVGAGQGLVPTSGLDPPIDPPGERHVNR
jgi:PLP dependent protein